MKAVYKQLRHLKAQVAGIEAIAESDHKDAQERVELIADLAQSVEETLERLMVEVAERIEE